MRISDWSSDVCSSDLRKEPAASAAGRRAGHLCRRGGAAARHRLFAVHSHRDRRGAVRGVVPGFLQGLNPHPTPPGAPVSGLLQRAIALMVIATKGVPPMRILAGLMTILLTSLLAACASSGGSSIPP